MFGRFGVSKIILSSFLIGSLAHASEVQTIAPDKKDVSTLDIVIAKVLNSIESATLDPQFEGVFENGKGLDISNFTLSGMLQFNQDITMPIIAPDEDAKKKDTQITRLFPTVTANTKGLTAKVDFLIKDDVKTTSVVFLASADAKKTTPGSRPLNLRVSNNLNASLLSLNLYSVKATITPDPKNPDVSIVKGSCESDKPALDLNTGRNVLTKMDCEFDGMYSNSTYKIHMKYVNRK